MNAEDAMSRVRVSNSGCWVWQGALNGGHGQCRWRGKPRLAHRVFYEIFVGEIPGGHHLHHVCGEGRCCNPDHLDPVTPRDHMRAHGRGYSPAVISRAIELASSVGPTETSRRLGMSRQIIYLWRAAA